MNTSVFHIKERGGARRMLFAGTTASSRWGRCWPCSASCSCRTPRCSTWGATRSAPTSSPRLGLGCQAARLLAAPAPKPECPRERPACDHANLAALAPIIPVSRPSYCRVPPGMRPIHPHKWQQRQPLCSLKAPACFARPLAQVLGGVGGVFSGQPQPPACLQLREDPRLQHGTP